MFDPTSRYYQIADAVWTDDQGRRFIYKRRRFLPQPGAMRILGNVRVKPKDRLDLIAAQTLGNPELFWRICDANGALNPFDLLESGATLQIPATGS